MKRYLEEVKQSVSSKKASYFVCVNGDCIFESDSLSECKKELLKAVKKGIKEEGMNFCASDYFVGMYNIDLF